MKRGTATVYILVGRWLVDPENGQRICEYVPQWWGRDKGQISMSVIEAAKAELKRANFDEGDTAALIDILERFFGRFDSGGAVWATAPVLMRLISAQPLSPLTGADDEWFDPMGNGVMLQNMRCGSVFKDWRDENGELSANAGQGVQLIHDIDAKDPFAPITFPYDPVTKAPADPVVEFLTLGPKDS